MFIEWHPSDVLCLVHNESTFVVVKNHSVHWLFWKNAQSVFSDLLPPAHQLACWVFPPEGLGMSERCEQNKEKVWGFVSQQNKLFPSGHKASYLTSRKTTRVLVTKDWPAKVEFCEINKVISEMKSTKAFMNRVNVCKRLTSTLAASEIMSQVEVWVDFSWVFIKKGCHSV